MNNETNQSSTALGIELKSKELCAVVVDRNGKHSAELSSKFDSESPTVPQLAAFLAEIDSHIGSFEEFGFAVPGLVDIESNKVVYSAQIPEHEKVDLAAEIFTVSGKKMYLENDANAAAFGELIAGAGKNARNMFYITVGIGVGGALILERKIWHGTSGYAGEFGFISVDSDGTKLEDMASAASIVRRAKTRLHQDPASSLFEIGEQAITFEDVIDAAVAEDGLAELILERTGMFLGTAVASVINLLNIEKIVIGGPLMKASNLVLNSIKKRAAKYSFEPGFKAAEIEAGLLGSNASPIGAALLVLNRKST